MESLIPQDWHDARDDLACYSSLSALHDPFVEELVVVEELCNNEVGASIYFLLQVADVIFSTLGCQMYLWIACDAYAEVVAVLLTNELHQVVGIVEPVLNGHPVCRTAWRIATKGKQVADAKCLGFVERLDHLVTSHIGTSDVH